MICNRCNKNEATLYFGDDFVCDKCAKDYQKCEWCDTFLNVADMQKAVREFMDGKEERVEYICDNCRCGV